MPKYQLSIFLKITFSQNIDQIQISFTGFWEKVCNTDQNYLYRPMWHHCLYVHKICSLKICIFRIKTYKKDQQHSYYQNIHLVKFDGIQLHPSCNLLQLKWHGQPWICSLWSAIWSPLMTMSHESVWWSGQKRSVSGGGLISSSSYVWCSAASSADSCSWHLVSC